MTRTWGLLFLLVGSRNALAFASLTPETANAFDSYVQAAESQMSKDLHARRFLHVDSRPDLKAKLRGAPIRVESAASVKGQPDPGVPGGLLQDWIGTMFIPGASIEQVRNVLQDYSNYKTTYRPEVIDSKELSHRDNQYDIFLRLYEKHILTVVLNAEYHVEYGFLDAKHMYVTSHSTKIAEVEDPDRSYADKRPAANNNGFLWRLNSYWRFEEADGGVYAECEAISLSRDVPLGLGFLLKGFLEKFPKESMLNTLRGTLAAVEERNSRNDF
jgi:hypothetical protein